MSSEAPHHHEYCLNLNPPTFADILFGDHHIMGAKHAVVLFPNQWGLSIIGGGAELWPGGGSGLYGDGKDTWEVAVIWLENADDPDSWHLEGDVNGWMVREMVEGMMAGLRERPPKDLRNP